MLLPNGPAARPSGEIACRIGVTATQPIVPSFDALGGCAMPALAISKKTAIRDAMHWVERVDDVLVDIRPIGPADQQREAAFLSRLPPEYHAYRFLGLIKTPSRGVARELTRVDHACEVALVAIVKSADGDREIGVARFRASADGSHCDCAVTVDPEWQQRGIGRRLMRHLIDVARERGIRRMYAADAARCAGAHRLAERLGFHRRPDPEDPLVTTFELRLA
jgi:GNAT superfamily N-acetyltransferase